jgi:hypothetical protein
MVQSKATTIKGYLDWLPEDRRKEISKVRSIIRKHLPNGKRAGRGSEARRVTRAPGGNAGPAGARIAVTFVGPGGITWLHRWALTQGKRGGFFAGEPTVPEWIEHAALPSNKG